MSIYVSFFRVCIILNFLSLSYESCILGTVSWYMGTVDTLGRPGLVKRQYAVTPVGGIPYCQETSAWPPAAANIDSSVMSTATTVHCWSDLIYTYIKSPIYIGLIIGDLSGTSNYNALSNTGTCINVYAPASNYIGVFNGYAPYCLDPNPNVSFITNSIFSNNNTYYTQDNYNYFTVPMNISSSSIIGTFSLQYTGVCTGVVNVVLSSCAHSVSCNAQLHASSSSTVVLVSSTASNSGTNTSSSDSTSANLATGTIIAIIAIGVLVFLVFTILFYISKAPKKIEHATEQQTIPIKIETASADEKISRANFIEAQKLIPVDAINSSYR